MAHQLGRTELEKLAPLRGHFFGRTGLGFGRKKWLAPPQKCPRNAYVSSQQSPEKVNLKVCFIDK